MDERAFNVGAEAICEGGAQAEMKEEEEDRAEVKRHYDSVEG